MELPDLPAGIYRHYKGHRYLVLGYGHDADYEGRQVVVYVGLELDDARPGPRLSVRTAESFLGPVEVAGEIAPRFAYEGPSWGSQDELTEPGDAG